MCRVLEVTPTGFYLYRDRPPSARDLEDEQSSKLIKRAFYDSDETYGTPRLKDALEKKGHQVSRARIGRLMKEMGLVARASRLRRKTSSSKRAANRGPFENKVQMKFSADQPNQM